jgi:DNA-binding MarR family transcriptional regulator
MDKINEYIKIYYESWFRINNSYNIWTQTRGINYNTLFVLYEVYNNSINCTQRSICDNLLLPKQTVSTILKKLEQQEYIYREINERDRRNKIVKLTVKGMEFASDILTELEKAEVEAYENLSEEERYVVTKGLHLFAKVIEKSFFKKEDNNSDSD